jgi:hypothetical protein
LLHSGGPEGDGVTEGVLVLLVEPEGDDDAPRDGDTLALAAREPLVDTDGDVRVEAATVLLSVAVVVAVAEEEPVAEGGKGDDAPADEDAEAVEAAVAVLVCTSTHPRRKTSQAHSIVGKDSGERVTRD